MFDLMTEPPVPTFVIRGTDALAIPVLRKYLAECRDHGLEEQAKEVETAVAEMSAWQRSHPTLTKLPDHKHVPASTQRNERS